METGVERRVDGGKPRVKGGTVWVFLSDGRLEHFGVVRGLRDTGRSALLERPRSSDSEVGRHRVTGPVLRRWTWCRRFSFVDSDTTPDVPALLHCGTPAALRRPHPRPGPVHVPRGWTRTGTLRRPVCRSQWWCDSGPGSDGNGPESKECILAPSGTKDPDTRGVSRLDVLGPTG